MARLFADENFPLSAIEALRRRGHDVLTIHKAGKAQQSTPDDIVLETASADGRAIVTLNRKHFVQLHAKQPLHAGSSFARVILILKGKPNEFMTHWNCFLNSPVN